MAYLFIVAWKGSMGRMRPIAILIAAALLGSVPTLTLTAHAQSTPLYVLDFSSPPHTVGLPVTTGAGPAPRNTVTSAEFGAPIVVSSLGALADQPLKLDSLDGKGDQIRLGLSDLPSSHVYCIESDVLINTQTPGRKFAILHDTPTIRNIEFINGVISAYVPYGVTNPYPGTPIGTYALGQVIRVRSEVDLAANAWSIFLNGILAHSGSFGGATSLRDIRFSTDVVPIPLGVGTRAAIDNVHVALNHCEPELDEGQPTSDTAPSAPPVDATPADVDPAAPRAGGSGSTLTPTAHAQPTPLYFLDFGSPPHTIGLPPATGAGPAPRNTVTSVMSGRLFDTPRVVSSLGALTDQPLKFDSRDWRYDQIALGLSDLPSSRVYCLETDVLIETQGASGPAFGRFAIHHDTPGVMNIDFVNGTIHASRTPIGTYALGQVIRVHSEVDLAADAWKIFLDGILAYSGSFGHARSLYQVRFGTMLGAVAAIDNVSVTPNYCEPEPDEADVDPPTTSAAVSPEPNSHGWNRTGVTVTLNATDNPGGSGVREIRLALNGAQGGARTIAGSAGSVTIAAEGVTSLTYFAVDNAGNQEPARTLTVRVDRSAPSVAGLPVSGCTLWPPNHRLVDVATVTASDSISGLASNSPSVVGRSSEPENGLGDGDAAPDIVIADERVSLRAERSGNGSGRVYTVTATASDLAGNVATATGTCTVPHDKR